MCGITAILCGRGVPASPSLYEALLALQHRGQDAAGIVTEDEGRLCLRKGNGMVRDVFQQESMEKLTGEMGIAHCRYPTAGTSSSSEAQPFYVNSPFGLTLAHNGNLNNTAQLTRELAAEWRHVNTGSDSEVLLNIFAGALLECLQTRLGQSSPRIETGSSAVASLNEGFSLPASATPLPTRITSATDEDILYAVRLCMRRCVGGYAVVAMATHYGILAFRDPHGIRPLVYGKRKIAGASSLGAPSSPSNASQRDTSEAAGTSYEYMVASESGALSALGFTIIGDVPAGHCLLLRRGLVPELHDCMPAGSGPKPVLAPCAFEYVYFARPDSIIDGISVYRTRLRMGDKLARRIKMLQPHLDVDVVIPVPDTARTAALECAAVLGVKYREGFMKNRYVGRTFIMPQQGLRKKSVRQKLAPIESEFDGLNVLLVDDSIVRGTTSREIVQMARDAGAKKVYMASAAPPVRFPNIYGIDMPTKGELVAGKDDGGTAGFNLLQCEEVVCDQIKADFVFYQALEDLTASIVEEAQSSGSPVAQLDNSCFDGVYVTQSDMGGSAKQAQYFADLAQARGERAGTPASAAHALDCLEGSKRARRA